MKRLEKYENLKKMVYVDVDFNIEKSTNIDMLKETLKSINEMIDMIPTKTGVFLERGLNIKVSRNFTNTLYCSMELQNDWNFNIEVSRNFVKNDDAGIDDFLKWNWKAKRETILNVLYDLKTDILNQIEFLNEEVD